ncbi:hypothetical protein DM02DRAFT_351238 [Periconia macrospinosa]|uniref:Uncharacterized protein n=1 Tax=Periconia macrospinosa TaxID=97972 RepID=A0A2V1EAP0_9PLEO|nr:hypothetical protein DM02DRAFT_351238 [Periconia macrospinosa]
MRVVTPLVCGSFCIATKRPNLTWGLLYQCRMENDHAVACTLGCCGTQTMARVSVYTWFQVKYIAGYVVGRVVLMTKSLSKKKKKTPGRYGIWLGCLVAACNLPFLIAGHN